MRLIDMLMGEAVCPQVLTPTGRVARPSRAIKPKLVVLKHPHKPGIEQRRKILHSLRYGDRTVKELQARLSMGRSTVLHHLAVLVNLNKVEPVPDTWPVIYRRKEWTK